LRRPGSGVALRIEWPRLEGPLVGRTLAHYDITAIIGVGGMGEVYRATDTRLGRDVALKVLPAEMAARPGRLERFQREAKSLAALDHPGIVTVYSVEESAGVHFLTMQLVEGQPLDRFIPASGLPIPAIVDIAVALTEALGAAHDKGLVHRDLKPANILITTDGRVKILDFGLAKLADSGEDEGDKTRSQGLTRDGTVMGTVPYMSPEQVTGRPVDHRSDLFSLGVILYEMATGRRPFEGNSAVELGSAILRDWPRSLRERRPELPEALDTVLGRCLDKDAEQRVQSAHELHDRFRTLQRDLASGEVGGTARPSSPSAPDAVENSGPSIAVLPLRNLSADPENEYFSDGLAEEILNALSQIEGLRVAARTSSFSFKGKVTDVEDVGRRLRVATVLEGSVRRSGSRVRVTVQLVDARNGFQLWSERYDRQMEDIFDVQDEIAQAIADRLKVTLGEKARRGTENLDAYELYLKGRHFWHQRLPDALRMAIRCFEQAIEKDPRYALAYAGLADCYGILLLYGWISAEKGRPPAHAAMTQAVALAPSLWEVSFSRAFYQFYFERDWRAAEPYFRKALETNPRSSLAHSYYGFFLAVGKRRVEDAVARVTLACEMDPLSPFVHAIEASALYVVGRCAAAERATRQALDLQADYMIALWIRGVALSGLGRHDEAIVMLERAVTLSRAPIFVGLLGLVSGRAGRLEDAARLLRELEDRAGRGEYVPAYTRLSIHVGRGDLPAMRTALAQVLEEATPPAAISGTGGPFLEELRADPEIDRMLRELYRE
jgi:serine/threonine protein kinase/Tfp pilus assembly protein PilF